MSRTLKTLAELLNEFELAYNLAPTLSNGDKLLLKNKINQINNMIDTTYIDLVREELESESHELCLD